MRRCPNGVDQCVPLCPKTRGEAGCFREELAKQGYELKDGAVVPLTIEEPSP
jgi:hypothetical protein